MMTSYQILATTLYISGGLIYVLTPYRKVAFSSLAWAFFIPFLNLSKDELRGTLVFCIGWVLIGLWAAKEVGRISMSIRKRHHDK